MIKKKAGVLLVKEECKYNNLYDIMFRDVLTGDGMIDFEEKTYPGNHILKVLRSFKFRRLTRELFDFLILGTYELPKAIEEAVEKYDTLIVFFLNSSVIQTKIPFQILRKEKEKYKDSCKDIFYVMYYIDPWKSKQARYANYLTEKGVFDLIYSFEKNRKDFIYWNTPYSVLNSGIQKNKSADLYFCGANKGRAKKLSEILKKCDEHDVRYQVDFTLDSKKCDFETKLPINVKKKGFWNYDYLLQRTLEADCILELMQEGQEGMSIRIYEAMAYNKKLLSDNPNILQFKYYDPRYMKYFKSLDEIDWDWVKRGMTVDYHYRGEYSPVYLFDDIFKRLGIKY